MLRRIASLGAGCVLISLAAVAPASAQARLTGVVAASFGQDTVAPAVGISLSYDIKPPIALELEFGILSGLSRGLDIPHILGEPFVSYSIFPEPEFGIETRIVSFSGNVIGRLGSVEQKVSPFVVLGGGVANVKRELGFPSIAPLFSELTALPGLPEIDRSKTILSAFPVDLGLSENAFMATVGGGFDIHLTSRLSAGADVRYQHVFSDTDAFGITRVGGRVSVKF